MDDRTRVARRRIGIAAAIACLALLLGASAILPIQSWVMNAAADLRAFGVAGAILFGALFVAAAMMMVPASPFSLAAGLIYGPLGVAIAWVAMMVAGTLAFWLARTRLGPRVTTLLETNRLAKAAVRVADDEGWKIVLLVRLSGIVPFGVQNYAFGITHLPLLHFLGATAIGVLPSIAISAGLGAFGGNVLGSSASSIQIGGAALAVVAGLTVVLLTVRKVREKLALEPD